MLSTLLEKTDPARRRVGTAIVFAVFYCVMAEYYKSITLWQGAAFGLLVWVGAHLVLMPLTGTVPSPFPWVAGGQTWAEHFSEALGHVIWLWSIELVRRDLRNRITHQPAPWIPRDADPARCAAAAARAPHSVGGPVISGQPTSFGNVVKRLQDGCRLAVDIPCTPPT